MERGRGVDNPVESIGEVECTEEVTIEGGTIEITTVEEVKVEEAGVVDDVEAKEEAEDLD